MNRTILTVAGVLSASSLLLVDSAIKGTVLLVLAAVVALFLRRDSAATRHLVWLLAIVAMLVVPVLSAMLPQWRVLPAWMSSSRPAVADVENVSPPSFGTSSGGVIESPVKAAPVEVERPSATVFQPATAPPDSPPALETPAEVSAPMVWSWNWINTLPLVWVIGFGVLMLRLSAARWMLWNSERLATVICRRVAPQLAAESRSDSAATHDPIVVAMKAICSQLGIGRPVSLLIHPDKTIPVVWGIFRCRLMLPAAARQWSDEQLQSVLLHELAHIKRRDTIVQLLTQVACALHWFNPLVWFAAWRLDVERERSCDDLVLASGIRPSAYAGHLLDVVTGLSPARWTQACGLAMARKSSLEGRLTAVLGKDLNRRGVSVALAGVALAIAVGVAVPIAMLRAADEKWNPPQVAHISSNDYSTYCVHDGNDASFVIAYHGDFGSATGSSQNPKLRTWRNEATLTLLRTAEKREFTLRNDHTAPDKLKLAEKDYDLAKGRVFLISDDGAVRQLDIRAPVVRDHDAAKKLVTLIAAIPKPNLTGKLAPETVAKLKWGEPVNGLRMALAYPPALGDALLGKEPYFQLVVQNVSEKGVRLTTGDAAPNPRRLTLQDATPVARTVDDVPIPGDWLLQPREVAFVRLFHSEPKFENGKTLSAMEEHVVSTQPRYSYVADMTIEKAPAGAWTGKLVTGQTRGSADVAAAPAPMHKDARALYEVWQRYARANGDIPGALVGELAAAVKTFIKYNLTWETVPKLNAILPRLDATHDWKPADVIALLDEVAAVKDSPLKPAPWKGTRHTIRQGESLPKKFADAPWGEAQPNGLRAAWVLEPGAAEHRIGAALKARLLVQNSGKVPVMLQVPTWHQGWVKAADAKGAEVQVSGISWTTMAMLTPVRLRPGDYLEIDTPGVGIGPRAGMGPWAGPRVGSNVLAKAGDELTLTHGLVPLDGSEVGVSEDDPHVSGPGWWLAHIKARLNRELPLPADAAERTRLFDRAVRELFATAPTAEEIAAFIADKTPDALDALAKRLTARVDVVSFSGKLPTAPAKFRVLAADANADKQPRVVLGPGEYPFPSTTARRGDATLKIVGRPVGDRRTKDAQLLFEATEFTGARPPDPHKLEVPDGWGTWAIVCRPDSGVLYLLSKGAVRKIDYTKPRNVTDTPANDLPAEFRDEVQRQLEIAGVSAEQQAVVFEKPAPPAATPEAEKPKGAAVKLTPDALLGFWRGTMDGKDLMLSFHRPPVEKDVQVHIYFGRSTIGRLARFNIAPDGDSALVVLEGGDNAALGTLRPIDANTMRLGGADKEGKAAAFAMLARDVESPATEPRQKEARELFEMWKRTANEDGTIPGTFIGQLATEVHAHVMANPNSDSGMKLPKLLPRFVTSRDWTQAEAMKLLDDLAYYSTQPIVARVAKAKLPSGPLWRTEVEFADIPVKISKWSEAKDGLRVGMRVVDADWRIGLGGGARVELWLHNAGDKDVTFKTTGPNRQDTGVAVAAIDAEGREHWADGVNAHIHAGPMDCKLLAGHVALAKKFEVTFAEPGSHEKTWLTPRFHGLKHGKYQLRCKWMDAYPDISKPGEWKGELTAPDHAFTLAAAVTAADLEAKPAPKLAKKDGTPAADEQDLRHEKRLQGTWQVVEAHVGGTHAPRERSKEQVWKFDRDKLVFDFGDGDPMEMTYRIDEKREPATIDLSPLGPREKGSLYKGIYQLDGDELKVHFTRNSAADSRPTKVEPSGIDRGMRYFVLKRAAKSGTPAKKEQQPFTAWGEAVGGLQAGLGFKTEQRAYTHGEMVTLVLRVRNIGKEDVKFSFFREEFYEYPPIVTDAAGKSVTYAGDGVDAAPRRTEVNLAPGKEIDLSRVNIVVRPASARENQKPDWRLWGTGKFQLQCPRVAGNFEDKVNYGPDPILSKLATGKLELEVKEPVEQEPITAWGKEVGGLQAGLGFKAGEKRAYTHGEWATLVVRVRNVGKEEVKFQYLRQFFVEQPPTVFNEKGELKQLGRVDAFGEHSPVEVKLAAGKEIELYELKLYLGTGSEEGIPKYPYIFGTGKFQVQYEKVFGNSSSGSIKLDPALSKLATGKLELEIKPAAPLQQEAPKPGAQLKPATEQKLKWGEPVNGLRMALAWPPTLGEPGMGDAEEFYLVVQNVSQAAVRLTTGTAAPNPRRLNLMRRLNPNDETILSSRTVDDVPVPGDWLLQPRESALVRLIHSDEKMKDERTFSAVREHVVSVQPQYSYTADMTIEKAPAGSWTGKLTTGETRGSADVPPPKSGVPLAEQTWPMPPWGAEKDGLSAGIRIIGEPRIGGEVKAELWVRNSEAKDVTFSQCPRADFGLHVVAQDKDGKEHSADITQFLGKPGFHRLLLPAGNIVKLKEFTMKLGAKKDGERVNLDLPPGEYKLLAVWSDTTSRVAPEGEWTGKLTTGEVEFKLAAANKGADAGKPAAKPPGANIVTVPDDQYVKSGFPKDALVGEGVMWNDVQNGLSLGYRITGDEWRILGKEVKVELWVRNPGDKDVKFQSLARPDIGLRMNLKGQKGEEHESNIVPNDRPPYGELRLLPPGHALKVKEFTVSLLWPENDVSGIKGHFFAIDPGAYKFHCEIELPGFSATGEGGKQLTPAAGEWTGKLTTRSLNVSVIAPDAPASKPRIRGKLLKPDGSPAADIQVRVDDGWKRWKFRGPGIPDLPWPVKTAADGTFSIEVAKGSVATNYEAFASSDDFAPLNAKVPEGGDVGVMQFAKGSRVTGRVIGLDGAGLAKVGIWCKRLDWHGRGPAPSKLTSTGADGTFSIPPIATGRHVLQILTRDLGAKELTVAFANHVIEAKDDAPVAVEIRPLPTVNLTLDARVQRGKPEFPDFELRVSGTLPGHKAGEPASYWTRQETTKLTEGKHTIAVPAGLQNATVRADRIYMRKDDEPAFTWQREGDEKRVSTNTLELGLMDKPQTISLTVQDPPAAEAPKAEKPKSIKPTATEK